MRRRYQDILLYDKLPLGVVPAYEFDYGDIYTRTENGIEKIDNVIQYDGYFQFFVPLSEILDLSYKDAITKYGKEITQ